MLKDKRFTLALLVASLVVGGCTGAKTSQEYFELAKNHQTNGDTNAAIIEYKNSIRQDPTNASVRLALGKLYLASNQYAAATKELERSVTDPSLQQESLLPLAMALFKQKEFEQLLALPLVNSSLATDDLVVAYVLRGQALMSQGMRDQALAEYSLANDLNEEAAYARLGQVMSASANTDYAQATELVKTLLDDHPTMEEAVLLYAGLAYAGGDYASSVAAYDKYIELTKINVSKINLLLINSLLKNDNETRAKEELAKLLKVNAKQPVVNVILAQLAYQDSEIELALKHALVTLESVSGNVQANLVAGMVLFRQEDYKGSYRHLSRVSKHTTSLIGPQIMQIINNIKRGSINAARDAVDNLSAPDQKNAALYVLAANEFTIAQDYLTALKLVEQALTQLPGNHILVLKRGVLKMKLGMAEGLDDLTQSLFVAELVEQVLPQVSSSYTVAKRFDELRDIAERLKKQYSDKPYGWNVASIIPFFNKDYALAEKMLLANMAKFPNNADALHNLAKLRVIQDDYEQALVDINNVLVKEPQRFTALQLKAKLILKQTEDIEQYKNVFKEAYSAFPESELILLKRATIHVVDGQLQQGIDLLNSIKSREQLSDKYWRRYGDILMLAGQPEQALKTFEQWAQRNPNSPLPLLKQIGLHEKLGRYNDGLRLVEQLATKFGSLTNIDGLKINLMMLDGQLGSARRLFNTYKKKVKNRSYIAAIEGELFFREQKYPQALTQLTKAYTAEPKARYALLLAKSNIKLQQTDQAVTVLKDHLVTEPLNRSVKSLLATMYVSANSPLAIELYQELIKAAPKNPAYLNNLAWSLSENGQYQQALKYIKKALTIMPKNPQVIDSYGVILFKMQQYQQAVIQFDKAISIAPQGIAFTLHKAEVLIAMAQKNQALELLNNLGTDIPEHLKPQLMQLRKQAST